MAERIDLTTPASTTQWRVRSLLMERGLFPTSAGGISLNTAESLIQVGLIGDGGRTLTHTWKGGPADADIVALNKLNLTTNTLNKRILDKLISDGVIVGTTAGSAD